MKKISLLSFFIITLFQLNAQIKWNVEAGGTPDSSTPAPYFSPQHLTIQVGDTVFWTNIQGFHNITTTSGPEDFSFGPSGTGWTHEYVFNTEGFYQYECSVGSHANTQFGSITVEDKNISSTETEISSNFQVALFPNPSTAIFFLKWPADEALGNLQLVVTDFIGRKVYHQAIASGELNYELNLNKFPTGLYTVSLLQSNLPIWSSSLQLIK